MKIAADYTALYQRKIKKLLLIARRDDYICCYFLITVDSFAYAKAWNNRPTRLHCLRHFKPYSKIQISAVFSKEYFKSRHSCAVSKDVFLNFGPFAYMLLYQHFE